MKSLFAFALISFSTKAVAIDELGKLKASYETAVAKATAPLKATYEKELQKLLERYTKAGNIDDASKVIAELKSSGAAIASTNNSGGVVASSSTVAPSVQNQTTFSPQSNERFFVNKTWKTPTGTNFSFEKGGVGKRSFGNDTSAFVWRVLADGCIEVTGVGNQGGNIQTWIFRFVDSNEAYYGSNKENLGAKLERR